MWVQTGVAFLFKYLGRNKAPKNLHAGWPHVGARKAVGDLGGSLAVLESELERALGVRV